MPVSDIRSVLPGSICRGRPPAEGPCSHSQARQLSQWRRLVFVQVSKTHILHLSSPCTKRPIWQTRKCLKCLHCYYTQTNFPHSVWKTCSSEFCAHAGTITGLWAVTWCHCVCRDLWRGAALCVSRIVPRLHWMCRNLWRGVTEFVATCSGVTVCVATGDAVQLCVCRELCHGITECVATCDVVSLFVSRFVTRCHCMCVCVATFHTVSLCVSRIVTWCHWVCRDLWRGVTECFTTCDAVSLNVSRLVTRCHWVCRDLWAVSIVCVATCHVVTLSVARLVPPYHWVCRDLCSWSWLSNTCILTISPNHNSNEWTFSA